MQPHTTKTIAAALIMLATINLLEADYNCNGGYRSGSGSFHQSTIDFPDATVGRTIVGVTPSGPASYYYAYAKVNVGSSTCTYATTGYVNISSYYGFGGVWSSTAYRYGSVFAYNSSQGRGGQAWVGDGICNGTCY